MSETLEILNEDQMKQVYGDLYQESPQAPIDKRLVPEQFWPLLPYARFWGFGDDWSRGDLLHQASLAILQNFKAVVDAYDNALQEWLLSPEMDARNVSDEYVAFAAMIMASDHAGVLIEKMQGR